MTSFHHQEMLTEGPPSVLESSTSSFQLSSSAADECGTSHVLVNDPNDKNKGSGGIGGVGGISGGTVKEGAKKQSQKRHHSPQERAVLMTNSNRLRHKSPDKSHHRAAIDPNRSTAPNVYWYLEKDETKSSQQEKQKDDDDLTNSPSRESEYYSANEDMDDAEGFEIFHDGRHSDRDDEPYSSSSYKQRNESWQDPGTSPLTSFGSDEGSPEHHAGTKRKVSANSGAATIIITSSSDTNNTKSLSNVATRGQQSPNSNSSSGSSSDINLSAFSDARSIDPNGKIDSGLSTSRLQDSKREPNGYIPATRRRTILRGHQPSGARSPTIVASIEHFDAAHPIGDDGQLYVLHDSMDSHVEVMYQHEGSPSTQSRAAVAPKKGTVQQPARPIKVAFEIEPNINDGNGHHDGEENTPEDATSFLGNASVASSKMGDWTKRYFGKARSFAGAIVENSHFQLFIVILILINSIMMGIATFDFVDQNPDIDQNFEYVDLAFLVVFTIELMLQFLYHGYHLFQDGWLVFDFLIVVMSWSLAGVQIVRTFRVFRALRFITRVKALKDLVSSLFDVLPNLYAIICLLLLIFYVYAVLCTVLFKNLYRRGLTDRDYFSRMDISLWTLFNIMTLDSWTHITRQVIRVYALSWLLFSSFVFITAIIGYNLIIAVVCDAVAIIANKDEEGKEGEESEEEEVSSAVLEAERKKADAERLVVLHERVHALQSRQRQVLALVQSTLDWSLHHPEELKQLLANSLNKEEEADIVVETAASVETTRATSIVALDNPWMDEAT